MSANLDAIGLPLAGLETPALCLDLDAYHRNVKRMAEFIIRRNGKHWRPHMKGQKAPELAHLAIGAGAIGVTCATVYEAEAITAAGVCGILIANQIAGERKLRRLARLQRRAEVLAATDSMEHMAAVSAAAVAEEVTIPVIVEVNVGMNRCGVAPGEPTVALAKAVHHAPGLRLEGLMGWEGHVIASTDPEEKRALVVNAMTTLAQAAADCRASGLEFSIVSASGSGTFRHSADLPAITEIQAGGGVFSDLSYAKWGLDHEFALTILARVVSRPSPTRIIVDAGFKTMSVQHGVPQPLGIGPVKNLTLSAEHGTIELEAPSALKVGDTISFVPGYTDSTVCLHDEMCALRSGLLEAVWIIPGRTGRR